MDTAIEGRLDAVADGRLFGWAWDRAHPGHRLTIEIRLEGEEDPLATGVADQPRADLRTNGVGDGAHAFEIALAPLPDPARLVVVARDPESGAERPLPRPSEEERRIEQALEPHMARLAAVAEAARAGQRRIFAEQQEMKQSVAALRERLGALAEAEQVQRLETEMTRIEERIGGLEVFLMRIDAALWDMHTARTQPPSSGPSHRMMAMAVGGAVAVALTVLAVAQAATGG